MRPNGRAYPIVQRIGHDLRGGVTQREQDVEFLLADPAAEHRVLDRRLGVGEVPLGLTAAEQRPPHGAVQLPPPLGFLVRRAAAAGRVARHQVGAAAEPAGRAGRAEPPGLRAQPAQVLPRVAAMGEFPVQHPVQPVRADHQVAGPEVTVDQRVRHGRRFMLGQPAQADLQRGPGLGEALVKTGQLAERVHPGQAGDLFGIYLMDPGQDLPQAAREPGAHGGVGVVTQQPARDRLPVQALHQQVVPAEGAVSEVVQLGRGDAGPSRRDHRRRLDGDVLLRRPAGRGTEQDEAALGLSRGAHPDVPALPARAAGQLPQPGDLDVRPTQHP